MSGVTAHRMRYAGGLVLAGGVALVVDLAVLAALGAVGVSPFIGRLVSISLAMVVSWLINRTVTFQVQKAPTLAEFARFAGVSWTAQAVNYAIFAAVLWLRPETSPTAAVLAACVVSVAIAVLGFRYVVFGAPAADRVTS